MLTFLSTDRQLKAERGQGMPISSHIVLSVWYHEAGKPPVVRAYLTEWGETPRVSQIAETPSVLVI